MREFDILERIFAMNSRLPACVTVPPGDDMAEISADSASLLVAADSAIEGRHVPMGYDAAVLGRKAVLRNLSDVAAMMNARPVATVACALLPDDCDDGRAWRLYEGMRAAAEQWGAPLVGGDLASLPRGAGLVGIAACVTILAVRNDPARGVATRSGARPGDGVFVTGTVGGSWDPTTGLGRHLDFTPRIAAANELSRLLGDRLGAAIDISDGMGRDLGHIARRSGVRIEVDLGRVPVTPGRPPIEAIADGEDYELAFTARGEVPAMVEGVPISRIGTVCEGSDRAGCVIVRIDGREIDAAHAGFEHGGAR